MHEYKIQIERNDRDRKDTRWKLTLLRHGAIMFEGSSAHNNLDAVLNRAVRAIKHIEEEESDVTA